MSKSSWYSMREGKSAMLSLVGTLSIHRCALSEAAFNHIEWTMRAWSQLFAVPLTAVASDPVLSDQMQIFRDCNLFANVHNPTAMASNSNPMICESFRAVNKSMSSAVGSQSVYSVLPSMKSTAANLGGSPRASANTCTGADSGNDHGHVYTISNCNT